MRSTCDDFSEDDDDDDDSGGETNKSNESYAQISTSRIIKSLFQILYFIVHSGRRRTPLHILCAEGIHATCKSKTLISELNHLGICVSYDEVLRYQNDLAELVCEAGEEVPLPSHINPALFTTAAFDNFDHVEATLSGLGSSHDTVSVLFQDKSDNMPRKPLISETDVVHGRKSFQKELKCQELIDFVKPAKKGDIHTDYQVCDELTGHVPTEQKDVAWSLARMDLSKMEDNVTSHICENQEMPTWSAFNSVVTGEQMPERTVGFLPILPYPVTRHDTVYTALKNFQNVLGQLNQSNLPIYCDEGVYHIAREILLLRPDEFSNLTLCLGSFHLLKIYLGCIGKYLRGSGAENVWTENEIFGPNTTDGVLGGSHYVRSPEGMNLLSEVMERLQWTTF